MEANVLHTLGAFQELVSLLFVYLVIQVRLLEAVTMKYVMHKLVQMIMIALLIHV